MIGAGPRTTVLRPAGHFFTTGQPGRLCETPPGSPERRGTMTHLAERLRAVCVDEPQESHGLQAFGLRWEPGRAPDYLTLDDALAAGQLEVAEVSDGGSVPTLKVTNKGEQLIFLMAGEQLAGGKQNRVLNAS